MIFHDFKSPKQKIPVLTVMFGRVCRVQSGGVKKLMPEMKSSRWVDVPSIFWNSQTPKIRKVTASWSQRLFFLNQAQGDFFLMTLFQGSRKRISESNTCATPRKWKTKTPIPRRCFLPFNSSLKLTSYDPSRGRHNDLVLPPPDRGTQWHTGIVSKSFRSSWGVSVNPWSFAGKKHRITRESF